MYQNEEYFLVKKFTIRLIRILEAKDHVYHSYCFDIVFNSAIETILFNQLCIIIIVITAV